MMARIVKGSDWRMSSKRFLNPGGHAYYDTLLHTESRFWQDEGSSVEH